MSCLFNDQLINQNLFPYPDKIFIHGQEFYFNQIVEKLGPFITDHKKNLIHQALQHRVYRSCLVAENIYDGGNINAVMRSMELMGYQSIHIIESEKMKYSNRVSQGAHKWLDIFRHKSTQACISNLKQKGYRVLATALNKESRPLDYYDFSIPTAIVLGNEKEGVSSECQEMADGSVLIPMVGLSQSYNISVAAALIMQYACLQRNYQGDLSALEQEVLKASYYTRIKESAQRYFT